MNTASNANYQPKSHRKIMMTRHATKRGRQRAVPDHLIPLIKMYGEQSHDGQGGIRYLMTQRAVQCLINALGYTKKLESLAGCYVVVAADNPNLVITIAHRH